MALGLKEAWKMLKEARPRPGRRAQSKILTSFQQRKPAFKLANLTSDLLPRLSKFCNNYFQYFSIFPDRLPDIGKVIPNPKIKMLPGRFCCGLSPHICDTPLVSSRSTSFLCCFPDLHRSATHIVGSSTEVIIERNGMNIDKLTRIIADKNERLERDATQTAEEIINEILRLQELSDQCQKGILEARAKLKALEIKQVDPKSIFGE